MFKIGDHVIYRCNGICEIIDIRREKFGKLDRQDYYVLKLLYESASVVYVPVLLEQSENRMRFPITKEEAETLVAGMDETDGGWIFDDKLRTNKFKEILDRGNAAELVSIVKKLYLRNGELTEAGRRLRTSDETIMKKAESNLFGELAYALGIEYKDVLAYIAEHNCGIN